MNAIRDHRPNDPALIELLRSADSQASPVRLPLSEDLAAAARKAAANREQFNFALAGSALVLVLVAGVAFSVARADLAHRRISDADLARLRGELTVMTRQADADGRFANQLNDNLQRRKQAQQRTPLLTQQSTAEKLAQQRDRAAMTMFLNAQDIELKSKRPDRALAQYRRVVELYPKSPAAQMARKRIDALKPKSTETKRTYPGSL
jgi:hypothetical protein